ncbi:hypothetical protein F1643_04825 [Azospirillum sp. INR13]|nr:hypothetical protein [Azospirillum sp. INR13]
MRPAQADRGAVRGGAGCPLPNPPPLGGGGDCRPPLRCLCKHPPPPPPSGGGSGWGQSFLMPTCCPILRGPAP